MKKIFEGPRADFSWGHLSVDGVERATEVFGQAVWEASDRVVANPNLLVRITVETVLRPILPGSHWKSKVSGVQKVVDDLVPVGKVMYATPEGDGTGFCRSNEDWYRDNEWVSDPESKAERWVPRTGEWVTFRGGQSLAGYSYPVLYVDAVNGGVVALAGLGYHVDQSSLEPALSGVIVPGPGCTRKPPVL